MTIASPVLVPAATTLPPAPEREALKAQLDAALITGQVATPRENNRAHYRSLADGDRYYWLGLDLGDRWTDETDVLAVMAERCGVSPDPAHLAGQDTISAELCVSALERVAGLLRNAAVLGQRVLFATGHPGSMLPVYQDFARALASAGARVLLPPGGVRFGDQDIRRVGHVAVVQRRGNLPHTHAAEPMRALLDRLEAEGPGLPELVVADHGWAGAAASAGLPTAGFADCNDPALFVGEAEGTLAVTVPLDDGVSPDLYEPMTSYVLRTAGLPAA